MDSNDTAARRAPSASRLAELAITGPEDIVINRRTGIAYISSQDRRSAEWVVPGLLRQRSVDWSQRGAIYQLALDDVQAAPVRMIDDLPAGRGFHPCGIDLHVTTAAREFLFVVNWERPQRFATEVFEVDGAALQHVATASSDVLTLPNDVVALNEHQFYVTNTAATRLPVLQAMEAAWRLTTGSVLFHDLATGAWTKVAGGIPYANGIAIDRQRGRLYVASTTSGRLFAFSWDPDAPSAPLREVEQIRLGFPPDNLAWEDEDTLWAAGSEGLLGTLYVLLLRDRAPSHVALLALPPKASQASWTSVYDDATGVEIAACSIAAPFTTANDERRFVVGSCFDDHAILCRAIAAA